MFHSFIYINAQTTLWTTEQQGHTVACLRTRGHSLGATTRMRGLLLLNNAAGHMGAGSSQMPVVSKFCSEQAARVPGKVKASRM